jgi:nuclear pore complex protein Nup98-Nup96
LLGKQMQATEIGLVDDIPFAQLRHVPVESLFHDRDNIDCAEESFAFRYEKQVWQLAGILFDRITPKKGETAAAARKAKLSAFWEDLVDNTTVKAMELAKTCEEVAIAALAGRKKMEACTNLLQGGNFRTATLVALLGSSEQAKIDMKIQLKQWREDSVLAEFSEPMRAIYELLGGNVCVSEGKQDGPMEHRMASFVISKRFGLDWRQAFGLRLWYGAAPQDDISVAVKMFSDDIEQGKEDRPLPFDAPEPDWTPQMRDNLLWALLKVYAGLDKKAAFQAEIMGPWHIRLPWQLSRVLQSKGYYSSGELDMATRSFADTMLQEGSWYKRIWVLLHLTSPQERRDRIRETLFACWEHKGLWEGDPDMPVESGASAGAQRGAVLKTLKIPKDWIYEAAAQSLHYQAQNCDDRDDYLELCLLRFGFLWLRKASRSQACSFFANDLGSGFFERRENDLDVLVSRMPADFVDSPECQAAVAKIRSSRALGNRADGLRNSAKEAMGRLRS